MFTLPELIGYAFGAIGIGLAVVFYAKQKIKKTLTFRTVAIVVLDPQAASIAGLESSLTGAKVASLAIGQVLFWNSGNTTLGPEDFAPRGKPALRIYQSPQQTSDGGRRSSRRLKIHSVSVDEVSNKKNGIVVARAGAGNHVQFGFDYLAPGDGGIFLVIFDPGDPHRGSHVVVDGTMKTGKSVALWKGERRYTTVMDAGVLILFAWILLAGVLLRTVFHTEGDTTSLIAQGSGVLAMLAMLLLRRRFSFGRSSKTLRKAFENNRDVFWKLHHSVEELTKMRARNSPPNR